MIDLIKRNYRRRLTWLVIKLILITIGIFGLWATNFIEASIFPWVGIIIGVLGTLLLFSSKTHPSVKNQLEALDQHSKADFEDLIHSVPLKEYFEI